MSFVLFFYQFLSIIGVQFTLLYVFLGQTADMDDSTNLSAKRPNLSTGSTPSKPQASRAWMRSPAERVGLCLFLVHHRHRG